ncbi:MAG: hypothetical protein IKT43_02840 [Clostridia bacterium]|nr:hypothetical protein [Clostridia bacterium]
MQEAKNVSRTEVYRRLFSQEKQVRVECEGTLPDYADDVHRIVRATPRVRITKRRVYRSEGRTLCEVGGAVSFDTVFRGEEGGELLDLFSHSFTQTFEEVFDLGETEVGEPYHLACRALTPTCTARAVGKKKCTYSATFTLFLDLFANVEISYLAPGGEDVETLQKEVRVSRLKQVREETFELEEEITVPDNLPPILELCDCSMQAANTFVKQGESGLEFGVAARLYCAYQAEDDEACRIVSFVKPIDITEHLLIGEECEAEDVSLFVSPASLKTEVLMDSYSARRILKFSFSYLVTSVVCESETLQLCADAYCLDGECEMACDTEEFVLLTPTRHTQTHQNFTVSTADTVKQVELATAEVHVSQTHHTQQGVCPVVSVLLRALCVRAEDGRVVPLEERVEFSPTFPDVRLTEGEGIAWHFVMPTVFAETGEGGVTFHLKADFAYSVFRSQSVDFITEFQVEKTREKPFSGVHFYYPAPDESLWDIARSYRVSRAVLIAQNALRENAPLPPMLMITK